MNRSLVRMATAHRNVGRWEGEPAGAPAGDSGGQQTTGTSNVQMTDKQLNDLIGGKKKEARERRDAELAELFGVPVEQVPDVLKQAKEDQDAKLGAQQKAERDAAQAQQAAQQATQTAAEARHELAVIRALYAAGLPAGNDDDLSDALKLIDSKVGDDGDAIKAAAEKLMDRRGNLFGGASSSDLQSNAGYLGGPATMPPTGTTRTGQPRVGPPPVNSAVAAQLAQRGVQHSRLQSPS